MKKTEAFQRDGDDRTLYPTARAAREAEFDALFQKISYNVGANLHARLVAAGIRELSCALRGGVYGLAANYFIAAAKYLEQHRLVLTGGKIIAGPVPNATKATLEPIITANVVPGAIISTDEHGAYGDLHMDLDHGMVMHSAKEYVRGIHHVNALEGHWSLLKRAIRGTHVHVSEKHAWKYISEFSYRRNMRHSHSGMFNLLVHAFSLPRVTER